MENGKEEINTTVNMAVLMARVAENLTDEEKKRAKSYIESLGIGISDKENSSLLYMTQRVVESYNFGRKLQRSEKRFVVKKILSIKQRKKDNLIVLIRRLAEVGLSEQQIYSIIINLAVNKCVAVGEKIYNYKELIKDETCQAIVDSIDAVSVVTAETITKAMIDAGKIVRRAVRGQGKSGALNETRNQLTALANEEVVICGSQAPKTEQLEDEGIEQE